MWQLSCLSGMQSRETKPELSRHFEDYHVDCFPLMVMAELYIFYMFTMVHSSMFEVES